MARRPGRKAAHAPRITRAALWADMRRLKRFTVAQLCPTGVGISGVHDYLRALETAGYVRREPPATEQTAGRYAAACYVLERDTGIDAPQLRRDGSHSIAGLAREQLWRSIRILREFSLRELTVVTSTPAVPVSEANASRYLNHLHRAGYLCCVRQRAPGRLARYRLLLAHNTGPNPPMVQHNGNLYDPNLGRVVWQPTPAAERGDG